MDLAEARKIDEARAAREQREHEAAEALSLAQRLEEAKRAHQARLQRLTAEIKEAEGAQVAFKTALSALTPLSDATLARCGADQSGSYGGGDRISASTAVPLMLEAAAAACENRLLRLREEHATLAAKKQF